MFDKKDKKNLKENITDVQGNKKVDSTESENDSLKDDMTTETKEDELTNIAGLEDDVISDKEDSLEEEIDEDDKIRDYIPSEGKTYVTMEDDSTYFEAEEEREADEENFIEDDLDVISGGKKKKLAIIERKINKAGMLIMVFNDYSPSIDLTDISMETNDALYVNFIDQEKLTELLKRIRQSDLRSIYLIPIFTCGQASDHNQIVTDLSDGTFLNIDDELLIAKTKLIDTNISLLKELHVEKYGKKVLYKLLRYMFTREYTLKAYIDPFSLQGYVYPFLDIHFKGEVFINQQEDAILEDAEKAGLLKSTFVDKIHICPQCTAGFHNFRELCPKCGSSDLTSQALIHHFVCAHVGPERDYKRSNILICPKCNRELRHIGVDYDKPSVIFECHDCGEYFQDPNIKVLCFNCKTENNVENLKPKDIKNYTITRYGIGIVKASLFHEEYSESKFPGCYSYNVFRDLLAQEVKRIKTLKTQAICGSIFIKIENIDDFESELIDNIYMVASKELTNSAASLCHFEDMFTFLLPYTNYDKAVSVMNQKTSDVNRILKERFTNINFSLKNNIIDIKIDDSEEELMNNLIINI